MIFFWVNEWISTFSVDDKSIKFWAAQEGAQKGYNLDFFVCPLIPFASNLAVKPQLESMI